MKLTSHHRLGLSLVVSLGAMAPTSALAQTRVVNDASGAAQVPNEGTPTPSVPSPGAPAPEAPSTAAAPGTSTNAPPNASAGDDANVSAEAPTGAVESNSVTGTGAATQPDAATVAEPSVVSNANASITPTGGTSGSAPAPSVASTSAPQAAPAISSPPPATPPPSEAPSTSASATASIGRDIDASTTVTPAAPEKASSSAETERPSGNLGSQFDLRPYSRPIVSGLGYSGFVQAQFINSDLSEDQLQQGNLPLNRDQFSLRAARLRVEQGYDFTAFGFELDASTTRQPMLSVRRAEATLFYRGDNPGNLAPLIALSAGVIDLPFGFEVAEAVRTRVFMERGVASSALFPTQNDVGLRLFGAWRFARYAFALVNGEPFAGNDWPSDPNARKDIVGRLGAEGDVSEVVGLAGGASFAYGKGFHAGRQATKDSLFWRDDNEDGMAQASEVVGAPGSSASPSSNFERFALGVDLELHVATPIGDSRLYGEVYVASNHDRALFVSDPVVSGVDVRQFGGYVAFAQELSPYAFVGVRADLYEPNSDLFETRRGQFVPKKQTIVTWSSTVGFVLPRRARLLAQYDFVKDYFGRDKQGVPSDAKNNQLTVRLQVEL